MILIGYLNHATSWQLEQICPEIASAEGSSADNCYVWTIYTVYRHALVQPWLGTGVPMVLFDLMGMIWLRRIALRDKLRVELA